MLINVLLSLFHSSATGVDECLQISCHETPIPRKRRRGERCNNGQMVRWRIVVICFLNRIRTKIVINQVVPLSNMKKKVAHCSFFSLGGEEKGDLIWREKQF